MKEEWKVYIRGNEERGKEVIKLLTDLVGGAVTLEGSNKDCIYFLDHDGTIDFEYLGSEMGKIIMDNYKEIKLPEQWKNGDILINTDGSDYKVFWEYDSDSDTSFYAHNVSIHNGTLTTYSGSIWHGEKMVCFIEDYRLATPSEAKRFHELLNKCGKDWDAKNKRLVDWKWKPKENDSYYYIDHYADIVPDTWDGCNVDAARYNFGNCFQTEEEAKVMAEKVKKLLKGEL